MGVFVNAGIGVGVMVGKVGVVVGNENVGRARDVFVGTVLCGSASVVLTVDMAVSSLSS